LETTGLGAPAVDTEVVVDGAEPVVSESVALGGPVMVGPSGSAVSEAVPDGVSTTSAEVLVGAEASLDPDVGVDDGACPSSPDGDGVGLRPHAEAALLTPLP
jgi:hypothetical protein